MIAHILKSSKTIMSCNTTKHPSRIVTVHIKWTKCVIVLFFNEKCETLKKVFFKKSTKMAKW
jgi:hypothetical protein